MEFLDNLIGEKNSKTFNIVKYVVFVLLLGVSGTSNIFIDKTQTQTNETSIEAVAAQVATVKADIRSIENDLKENNLQVLANRVGNLEDRIKETNLNLTKLNEKADKILLLLAGG